MGKIAKLLLFSSFPGTFAESLLLPLWSAFTDKVGGSILDAGIGFAIFSIINGILILTLPRFRGFQQNLHKVVFAGFLISGIGKASYLLVTNHYQLFAAQAIAGIATGLPAPAWDTLFSEDMENSLKGWSIFNSGISIFEGAAFFLGGLIVSKWGFHALFSFMLIFNILASCLSFIMMRDVQNSILSKHLPHGTHV